MTYAVPGTSPQAVVFDLDGTLIDSLEDIANAGNRMLTARGLAPLPVSRYPEFIGEGARKLVTGLLAGSGEPITDDIVHQALTDFREQYSAGLTVQTRPYPDIPELLAELEQRRLPLAVLSNKPDDWTRAIVRELLPEVPFVEVRGQRKGVPRKPDPTAALELAQALAIDPAQVAFVGDTRVDIETARAAGMRAVAVTWGFTPAANLEAAGATALAADVLQLRSLLVGN